MKILHPCPICHEAMPAAHFLVCRACWREVPFLLRVTRSTHMGREYAARNGGRGYDRAAEEHALHTSERAILSHLRLHGSAIPA